jgi:uncharacterized membrane protein YgcG
LPLIALIATDCIEPTSDDEKPPLATGAVAGAATKPTWRSTWRSTCRSTPSAEAGSDILEGGGIADGGGIAGGGGGSGEDA